MNMSNLPETPSLKVLRMDNQIYDLYSSTHLFPLLTIDKYMSIMIFGPKWEGTSFPVGKHWIGCQHYDNIDKAHRIFLMQS